ncbi:MAG TPA: ATP synthase F1 subunit epsilon [Tepidisphaeraceae bacterium]|nr:ATP synthase F1 subunit epsilon [Tepidisphaeraceae bacterium]
MAFRCVVVTPEQEALNETISQAILPAHDGMIGILTGRSPLLVKLGIGPLRIDLSGGQSRTYFINGGIAQMKDNDLTILTTEAVLPQDIDIEAARAQYAQAEAQPATDDKSRAERQRLMKRGRVMQEIAGRR